MNEAPTLPAGKLVPARGAGPGTSVATQRELGRVSAIRTDRFELYGWLLALVISGVAAAEIFIAFHQTPLPPGGDPGNWMASSYPYVGHPYPAAQIFPLAYPPLLFFFLAALYLISGNPATAVNIFVPFLVLAVGFSTFALTRRVLRSKVLSVLALGFLFVDPPFFAMFFWGAYPNLLAFVFMSLAFSGLIQAGTGRVTRGAFQFWVFFSLTILTHSLAGLIITVAMVFFGGSAWVLPRVTRSELVVRQAKGTLDSPRVALEALWYSRGGRWGVVFSALTVGGYYLVGFVLGIPHPNYAISSPNATSIILLGGVLQALLPGIVMKSVNAFYLLAFLVVALGSGILLLRSLRPNWLSTGLLAILAWIIGVLLIPMGGWIGHVVTDYHRFGFFLLIPVILGIAYLLDRTWISRRRETTTAGPVGAPNPPAPSTIPASGLAPLTRLRRGWFSRSGRFLTAKTAGTGVVGVLLLLVLASTLTGPALDRDQRIFTRVAHDPEFLAAVHALQRTGVPGSVLTVPAALKWVQALTSRDTYAPFQPTAYLFYQSQVIDSQLAYYALTTHYALTNGLVTVSVRGTNSTFLDGVPDFSAYIVGSAHPVLRLAPETIAVTLVNAANGSSLTVPISGDPQVFIGGPAGPINLVYTEPQYVLTIGMRTDPVLAQAYVSITAVATSGYRVVAVNASIANAPATGARVWPTATPGSFLWQPIGMFIPANTYVNVTPSSAFRGITNWDPNAAGPTAVLLFTSSAGGAGSTTVTGSFSLSAPVASTIYSGLPTGTNTPLIWQQYHVTFVLMQNSSYAAPNPIVALPGEVPYLVGEFHCQVLYQNVEWTLLRVPGPF